MSIVPEGFRVRLVRDYTRYRRDLKTGAEGVAVVPAGRAALAKNQFLSVRFDGNEVAVEIVRNDLDVIDPRWKAFEAEEAAKQTEALEKHVAQATLWTTPRGGFVELVVEYSNGRPTDRWKRRSECKEILASLERRGLLEEAIRHGNGGS